MTSLQQRPEEDLFVRTDYRILFEDSHMMAVEKPSPLPVHAVGRFRKKNLLSLLQNSRENASEFRIVNRLDSETSGVVLVAKTREAASFLGSQFEERSVQKEYVGIVFGRFEEKKGTVTLPLGSKIEDNCHLNCY